MIPLIGQLYRNNNVVSSIYGRSLINRSVIAILKAHRFARHRQSDAVELSVHETFPLIKAMSELKLGAASVDLGKLAVKFKTEGNGRTPEQFVREELASVVGQQGTSPRKGTDVVLYGFGRIGRLLARILIEKTGGGDGLRLRAIVVRKGAENDLVKRASLLRRDSVHGPFDGTITIDEANSTITANGNLIQVIYAKNPSEVDYTQYGIKDSLLVDNTGVWRDADGLGQHLACPGVDRVVLTAPGKGKLKNIVHGINHGEITADDKIVSAASCTTNAIVPVLKAVNDKFGITNGHVETVHSYTNDQNLIDVYHTDPYRARSATQSMIPSKTGAAEAVGLVLPELAGKLTGMAVRVPVINVSLVDLTVTLKRETTVDEVNALLKEASQHSKVLGYNALPLVSHDFNHNPLSSIFDANHTKVSGKLLKVLSWYDNEWAFSNRMLDNCLALHNAE
ncbi:glyceraldehyde-3-phosphate dehydrogenase [Pseudomonas savastanoi]|uniref:glyceraldehyde-3-phosphate dehydrogenase n=1 Tax=Pseudomonas savastanoi TaxID=29438 RepID=UPI003F6A3AFD